MRELHEQNDRPMHNLAEATGEEFRNLGVREGSFPNIILTSFSCLGSHYADGE